MKSNQMLSLFFALFVLFTFGGVALPVDQPKTNVWVTLANASGLDTLCLSTTTPENPFSTCLVNVPIENWPIPEKIDRALRGIFAGSEVWEHYTPVNTWEWWTPYLPKISDEPEELEILGSVKVKFCVEFYSTNMNQSLMKDVSPYHPVYKNHSFWCNNTFVVSSAPSSIPLQLPRGMFFVCGDRAWPAIPSNIKGGPCTLGELTLFTPNMKTIANVRHRQKRSTPHQCGPECKDDFTPWGYGKRLVTSLLMPPVASVVALKQLDRLGCWLSKQSNATSLALSGLFDISRCQKCEACHFAK
ncbi:uncharacterized protein [Aphelocoma coerulescens]|uniref:uncharacterized protein n=1 Tax=Aphelocoma coerulescens TaxID=39617 RepID=UPI0036049035